MSQHTYSLPKRQTFQKIDCFTSGVTKTIPLKKNLIGEPGTVAISISNTEGDTYISFSGTNDLEDWIYNINTSVKSYWDATSSKGFGFHEGFYQMASEVVEVLNSMSSDESAREICDVIRNTTGKIYWCGHSAGGALAGICSILVNKEDSLWADTDRFHIIDFGCPRYLSSKSQLPDWPRTRVQDVMDLVPCTPLTWRGPFPGYKHYQTNLVWCSEKKVIDTLPMLRVIRMILTYGLAVLKFNPFCPKIVKFHSVNRYVSSLLTASTKGILP